MNNSLHLFTSLKLYLVLLFFPVFAFAQADIGVSNITQPTDNPGAYSLVQVVVTNYGTNAMTSATINWSVNGMQQTPYVLSNFFLGAGQSYDLYIGGYTFMAGQDYTITASTSQPNGASDTNPSNDSFTITLSSGGGPGPGTAGLDVGVSAYVDPLSPANNYTFVEVTLTNYGTVPVTEMDVNWSVNGEVQVPYRYIGPTLQPGASIDIYIGGYFFNSNATYTIEISTDNPDGGVDNNMSNDGIVHVLNGALDLFNLDAGIVSILQPSLPSSGFKLIRVRLKNYGIEPLETVTINWKVNNVAQVPYQYTGPSLASREEIDIYIGLYLFSTNEDYFITSSTANPNGGTDQNMNNNSANISF